jgi:hypothetical protein
MAKLSRVRVRISGHQMNEMMVAAEGQIEQLAVRNSVCSLEECAILVLGLTDNLDTHKLARPRERYKTYSLDELPR